MSRPAWRALSPTAQALYPWFKLEWKGPRENNNGYIRFSVRQAAECIGITPKTAARAIHDLQRKGWLVVRKKAFLGIEGQARGNEYEITEIAVAGSLASKEEQSKGRAPRPRCLYQFWSEDNEYPVAEVHVQNPRGKNGQKQNPVVKSTTFKEIPDVKSTTGRSKNDHEQANSREPFVVESMTSLLPGGVGEHIQESPEAAQPSKERSGFRAIGDTLNDLPSVRGAG